MATTIRVEEDVKKELDKVLGLVQSETGERLSQGQLLARLLRFARQNEGRFLAADQPWRPWTRAQLAERLASQQDWGVETDSSDIDDVLYGDDAVHGRPEG